MNNNVHGYSIDGCSNCESVRADAADAEVYMEWHELSGSTIPEIARSIAADLTMSTNADAEIELPVIVITGPAAVELFCKVWMSVPADVREAVCHDGTCTLGGIVKGQSWDFEEEDE